MGSIKKAFDLSGKSALITGGSRGLGLQIAEALGEQGAKIVLSSRKAPDLEQAQKHLAGLGIKADWIANVLPGYTVVPSGVVAVNGAQSKGCSYCYAG